MKKVSTVLIFLVCLGCNSDKNGTAQSVEIRSDSVTTKITKTTPKPSAVKPDSTPSEVYPVIIAPPMKGAGVLWIDFSSSGDTRLFDTLGNIFCELDFSKKRIAFKDRSFAFASANNQTLSNEFGFSPRVFELEFEFLLFDCTESETFYEVVTNQKTGERARISKNDPHGDFLTWEQLIQKCYVSFDPKTNPLRLEPSEESKIAYQYNDYFFKATEIRGDWMKIKCNNDCKICGRELIGWIKWRESKNFLIQLGLIC